MLGHKAGLVVEGGRLVRVDDAHPDGEQIDVPALAEGRRNGPEYFVECVQAGRMPEGLVSLEIACQAQRILEAGLVSSRTGSAVHPANL